MDVMLRPWRPEDAPSIARHADDPQVAANLRDVFPCPYQLSDAEEFIRLGADRLGTSRIVKIAMAQEQQAAEAAAAPQQPEAAAQPETPAQPQAPEQQDTTY